MEVLHPSRVIFKVFNRNIESDRNIPIVSNIKDLTGGNLYSSHSKCEICANISAHCRGHIGKILLRNYHIRYMYRDQVDKLCKLICSICYMPLYPPSPSLKAHELRSLQTLYTIYNNNVCSCASSTSKIEKCQITNKVNRIYMNVEALNTTNELKELFKLGDKDQVVVRYIIVLPSKLLDQIPNGSEVVKAYSRFFEKRNTTDQMLQDKLIDDIYKAYAKSIDGKPGIMRQQVLPRRVSNSARAVIISDASLGLCDVGIPRFMSRSLYADIVITRDNIWDIVKYIVNGSVYYITYDNWRYKLVSSEVVIRVSGCITQSNPYTHSIDLPIGSKLLVADESSPNQQSIMKVIGSFNGNNHESICNIIHKAMYILLVGNDLVTLTYPTSYMMFVNVSPKNADEMIPRISLQQGCKISTPTNGQKTLVHRNPVLSAGSMRLHNMIVVDNKSSISMSLDERYEQRVSLIKRRHKTLLGMDGYEDINTPVNFDEYTIHGSRITTDPRSTVMRYSVTTSKRATFGTDYDTNCCISLNPLAVTTYQGDFDGDEMNVFSLNNCDVGESDLSLIGDLRRGTFGPIHDAMYGLYCITHDMVSVDDNASNLIDNNKDIYVTFSVCNNIYSWCNGVPNLLISSFLIRLRLFDRRLDIDSHKTFNRYFCNQIDHESARQALINEYGSDDIYQCISMFYSDVGYALCRICDNKGMFFNRKDMSSISNIIASGCRPKESTREVIYGQIGSVSYVLPKGIRLSNISSNYSTGVSEEEYMELCYSNRLQAANKAMATAPEGENMRMQCNYMSDMYSKGDIWYNRKNSHMIHEILTEESITSSAEYEALCSIRVYRNKVDGNCPRLKYRHLSDLPSYILEDKSRIRHYGQRKLFMSEMEFLTKYANVGNCLVVYAGAAGGAHISALSQLFPNVIFHLYDTTPFSSTLYNKLTNRFRDRIYVNKEYLTDEIAKSKYSQSGRYTLLISDIRTNTNRGKPSDSDIARDNDTNLRIILAMQPSACCIKFRLPYKEGETFLPLGERRLQCWCGVESTEVRLFAEYPYVVTGYDHREHEEIMYYHNLLRPYSISGIRLSNYIENSIPAVRGKRFYDMYRETEIIQEYASSRKKTEAYIYTCIDDVLGSSIPRDENGA